MRLILAGVAAVLALASPVRAEPPVWIVRDGNSEMLLFGSIHVLPPGLDWRPQTLMSALRKAGDVWFELPPGPAAEQEVARLAGVHGVLQPGQSLFRLMPTEDSERLMKVADAYGLDRLTLDRLEPWLAEVALAGAAYGKAGAAADYGVEKMVASATPRQARRKALETPAEQIRLFDAAPMAEQLASLRQTVADLDEDPDAYVKLVRAWMAGDVAALDREALEPLRVASPGAFRRLVTDRNARWAQALDARLKGHGRTVVVVGVGHLVGADSLPERLRALGYSVTGP